MQVPLPTLLQRIRSPGQTTLPIQQIRCHYYLPLSSGFHFPPSPQNSNKPKTSSHRNQKHPTLLIPQVSLPPTAPGYSFCSPVKTAPVCGTLLSLAVRIDDEQIAVKLISPTSDVCLASPKTLGW